MNGFGFPPRGEGMPRPELFERLGSGLKSCSKISSELSDMTEGMSTLWNLEKLRSLLLFGDRTPRCEDADRENSADLLSSSYAVRDKGEVSSIELKREIEPTSSPLGNAESSY